MRSASCLLLWFLAARPVVSATRHRLHVRQLRAPAGHVDEAANPDDYVFAGCLRLKVPQLRLVLSGGKASRSAVQSSDPKMTVVKCAEECKAEASIHFALAAGDTCLCFDHFDTKGPKGPPAMCNSPCAGDSAETCGGTGSPMSLQVYTYAHHAVEPEKDAIWLCGPLPQPKGSLNVTGDGLLRNVECAKGFVPLEAGGAKLLCDANARQWVPQSRCASLEEALKSAQGELSAAMAAADAARAKADQAEIDAADAAEKARKAQMAKSDMRLEAARLARVACKGLTAAAPRVEVAQTVAQLEAESAGAGDAAQKAADGLKAAADAAAAAEAAEKAVPKAAEAATKAADDVKKAKKVEMEAELVVERRERELKAHQ